MSHARPILQACAWLILAVAAILLLPSCHGVPLAPQAVVPASSLAAQGNTPPPPAHDQPDLTPGERPIPVIRDIHTWVSHDSLYVRARFQPTPPWSQPEYSPRKDGAWQLQFMMNTDQAPTGYPWRGIDYLVRGSEELPGDRFVIRRVMPEPDPPGGWGDGSGGWGPPSGSGAFSLHPQGFLLTIPLAAIGDDDGALDFVLELYRTVVCPECVGGYSAEYIVDYFGSTNTAQIESLADLMTLGVVATPVAGAGRIRLLAARGNDADARREGTRR